MQANLQISFYSNESIEKVFLENLKHSIKNISNTFLLYRMYVTDLFLLRVFKYVFRKRFTYPELTETHKATKEFVRKLKYSSENQKNTNVWIVKKILILYSDFLKMLEDKRKQESELMEGLLESFKGISQKAKGYDKKELKEVTTKLEHELQSY